jgi:hypothetical protein
MEQYEKKCRSRSGFYSAKIMPNWHNCVVLPKNYFGMRFNPNAAGQVPGCRKAAKPAELEKRSAAGQAG